MKACLTLTLILTLLTSTSQGLTITETYTQTALGNSASSENNPSPKTSGGSWDKLGDMPETGSGNDGAEADSTFSRAVVVTSTGLDIPDSRTILGVQVAFYRGTDVDDTLVVDYAVSLWKGGWVGDDIGLPSNSWAYTKDNPPDAGFVSYGGPSFTWGLPPSTLTPDYVRAPDFGAGLSGNRIAGGGKLRFYSMDITVTAQAVVSLTAVLTPDPQGLISSGDKLTLQGSGFEARPGGSVVVNLGGVQYSSTTSAVTVSSLNQIVFDVPPPSGPSPTPWTRSISVGLSDEANPTAPVPVTTEPFSVTFAGCGNGIVEAGEECEDEQGPCCSSCAFLPADTVCLAASDDCDAEEVCSGSSPACPIDLPKPAGTVCSGSSPESCALPSVCDGVSKVCAPTAFRPPSYVCRPSNGPCDVAETCTGLDDTCPIDQKAPGSTQCAADSTCAFESFCTGSSDACPPGAPKSDGAECRPASGICDIAETCLAGVCPPDAFKGASFVCANASGLCERDQVCSGISPFCLDTPKLPQGTPCRPSLGPCGRTEVCDGTSGFCPPDLHVQAGTVCSASTFPCVADATCDGASETCPANMLAGAETVCRTGSQACDKNITCAGDSPFCGPPEVLPAGTVCRPAGPSLCEPALVCSGASSECVNATDPLPPSCLGAILAAPAKEDSSATVVAAVLASLVAVLACILLAAAAVWWRKRRAETIAMPDFDSHKYYTSFTKKMTAPERARARAALLLMALVEADESFAFALAMMNAADFADRDLLVRSILYLYEKSGNRGELLIAESIRAEVDASAASAQGAGSLFRANSIASKLWQAYARRWGLEHMWASVGHEVALFIRDTTSSSAVTDTVAEGENMSFDLRGQGTFDEESGGAPPSASLGVAKYVVMALAQRVLNASVAAADALPPSMLNILVGLHRAVTSRFDRMAGDRALLSFVYLRFLCPAISVPSSMGVVPTPIPAETRSKLVVVSKLVQNVANKIEFGQKEPHMIHLNDFVTSNIPTMDTYVANVLAASGPPVLEEEGEGGEANVVPARVVEHAALALHWFVVQYFETKPEWAAQFDALPPLSALESHLSAPPLLNEGGGLEGGAGVGLEGGAGVGVVDQGAGVGGESQPLLDPSSVGAAAPALPAPAPALPAPAPAPASTSLGDQIRTLIHMLPEPIRTRK